MDDYNQRLSIRDYWLLLIIVGLCVAATIVAFKIDEAVIGSVQQVDIGNLSVFVRLVTELGHGMTGLILFLLLFVFYGEYRTSAAGILSLVSVGVVTWVVKPLLARPRPGDWGHSFPSGHTATAFAMAVVLANRFPRFKYVFYLLAVGVALSRVALIKHYPSDVCAGAALGLIVGAASVVVCSKAEKLPGSRWLRPAAFILLLGLSTYSILGSDVPKDLVDHVGPLVVLVLARRVTRTLT